MNAADPAVRALDGGADGAGAAGGGRRRHAQEGEIEFTFSADVADLAKIPGGADREVSVFEANLVITETVAGPMERLGARCIGLGEFDSETLASQSRGSCVWQDAEGDRIFDNIEDSGTGGAAWPARGR